MLRRISRWLADGARLAGAAFYWNTRKTAYVLRGRRGRCPCQNESDLGRGKMVACDAVLGWHEPERFRRVCPLLFGTDEGWVCSVPAAQVRPFWGRVVAGVLAFLVVGYLAAALAGFAALRVVGHAPVRFVQVAWPGKWSEIRRVQSEELLERAVRAFLDGRLAESQLALSTAVERDANNYTASLLLAQIGMFQGSFLAADAGFEQLRRRVPREAARTAIAYHDTLLGVDRMPRLAVFSLEMAVEDKAQEAIWVRSALLAVRALPPAELGDFLQATRTLLPRLSEPAQTLLHGEIGLRHGARVLQRWAQPRGGPLHPFYATYQVERLADLGATREAQTVLDFYAARIGPHERSLMQFVVAQAEGDAAVAQGAFADVLRQPLTAQRIDRVAGVLIRHPNAAAYRALVSRIARDPALEETAPASGLWVCGLVCGAPDVAARWQTRGRQPLGVRYPPIKAVDFSSRSMLATASPVRLVNTLSLPREVILSLYSRLEPREQKPASAPAS